MNSTNYKYVSEKHLLLDIRSGSEAAFRYFYDLYRPKIYHTALRYLKSTELSKEVVQDVFLTIWADRHHLDKITSLQAWVYRISKNNILNKLKRLAVETQAKVYLTAFSTSSVSETENLIQHKEYQYFLSEAVNALPEQQKKVFELARNKQLSYEKIGEQLNLSPLTVKTHMARALKSIRLKMSELGVEVPLFIFLLKDFLD